MKVDAAGRIFCTGTGGVWMFEPDGTRIGITRHRKCAPTSRSAAPT